MSSTEVVKLYPSLAARLAGVEAQIARIWETESGFLHLAVRRTLSGRGKRLRPMLTLLAAESAGGVTPGSLHFAAVAEIVHTASLIHDDVIDGALSRRGRRSAKADWGNKISVLLGDYLLARAFLLLAECDHEHLGQALAEVARRMCDGQITELRHAGRMISEQQYLHIVRAKTGSLFGLCGKAGVITAGGSPELALACQEFGEQFGLAFQVADDILDLVGSGGRSGKPPGRDLAERKFTLPLILAAKSEAGVRTRLGTILKSERITGHSVRQTRELVQSTPALEQSWEAVHEALSRARAALRPVPESEAKQTLLALAGTHFPLPLMQ